MNDYVIEKSVRKNNGYFTVNWSPLLKTDKYLINSKVPSMSGIYELYYLDEYKKLNIIDVDIAWYGGLRSKLRRITDPELEDENLEYKHLIEKKKLYFRFTLSKSYKDLVDVLYFFVTEKFPGDEVDDSGRYDNIFVNELSANKITTI